MEAKKRGTIIVCDSGIATNTTWWDQLTVSESRVVLTAIPRVAPPVVLTVVALDSVGAAQEWFEIISGAVNFEAHSVDVRRHSATSEPGSEGLQ